MHQPFILNDHIIAVFNVSKIEAEVSGWVGIGFSPKGGMTDADIIMAWVDAAGEAHVEVSRFHCHLSVLS